MTTAKTVLDFLEKEIQECTVLDLLNGEILECTDIDVVRRNIKDAPNGSCTEGKWIRREVEIVIAEAFVEAPKCTNDEVARHKYMNARSPGENRIWLNRSNEINHPDTAIEASQCTDAKVAEQNARRAQTYGERDIWAYRRSAIIHDRAVEEISQCTSVEVAKRECNRYRRFHEKWYLKWVEFANSEAERDVPKCIDAEVALQKSIDAPPGSKAQIAWTALRHELVRDEISKCILVYVARYNCEEASSKEEKEMWEARWIELRWYQ